MLTRYAQVSSVRTLNGDEYVAIPLKETEKMKIGYLKRKGAKISHIGEIYVKELKKYKEKAM